MASEPIEDNDVGEAATKSQRFICFVGNLPFTSTNDSIQKHFTKVQPQSVRHCTVKGTGKSKGYAFLEFSNYDRMKTCLQLYHHSTFNDGQSPARKINVELTAGGGGSKSKTRKSKLLTKNGKLNEQRKRRAEKEAELGHVKERSGKKLDRAEADVIHPSRRGQVPKHEERWSDNVKGEYVQEFTGARSSQGEITVGRTAFLADRIKIDSSEDLLSPLVIPLKLHLLNGGCAQKIRHFFVFLAAGFGSNTAL
ncbi:MAG: hypothetical protein MMC33_008805 [Icmadophila ericetorum]|nr:hypothetical protein [Icmadophila ericetorum]